MEVLVGDILGQLKVVKIDEETGISTVPSENRESILKITRGPDRSILTGRKKGQVESVNLETQEFMTLAESLNKEMVSFGYTQDRSLFRLTNNGKIYTNEEKTDLAPI